MPQATAPRRVLRALAGVRTLSSSHMPLLLRMPAERGSVRLRTSQVNTVVNHHSLPNTHGHRQLSLRARRNHRKGGRTDSGVSPIRAFYITIP